ncbi:unnamed protein product [Ilex paraguariensis]|uniref:Uncharacterized protein n=1 Tax=Ilex paraguariensis TaxID=185542 RepID=A0ABC8S563_9AQUA
MVSIFNVPRTLMASNPDSYTPQEVAIGPYHYWSPELYEMQKYKLAAAQTIQKQLQNLKFQHVVEKMIKHGPRIRAYYHKYLDFNDETLAWMMAVDASFLLEFLQIFAFKQGKELTRVSSRMSHLIDVAGRKSAYNAILRDIVMLENQIPLFVLRKMLKIQFSSMELADNMLVAMLMGLCNELSPFKFMEEEHPNLQISKRAHLLDVLYHVFIPEFEEPTEITEAEEDKKRKVKVKGKVKETLWGSQVTLNNALVRFGSLFPN